MAINPRKLLRSWQARTDARGPNRRSSVVDPDGGRRTYTYDGDGRVIALRDPSNRLTTISYDLAGRKTGVRYASGVRTGYGLDAVGQILTLISDDAGSTTYNRFTYTYDAIGNRDTVRDLNGSVTTYTYDAKNRLTRDLTSVTNAHDYTYTYDGNDNRLTSSETGVVTQYAYDAANRLVTSVASGQTTSYSYNNWGALSLTLNPDGTRVTQTSDLDGKLLVQSDTSGVTTMGYAADGLMRFEHKPASRTTLIWDGSDYLGEV